MRTYTLEYLIEEFEDDVQNINFKRIAEYSVPTALMPLVSYCGAKDKFPELKMEFIAKLKGEFLPGIEYGIFESSGFVTNLWYQLRVDLRTIIVQQLRDDLFDYIEDIGDVF